MAVEISHTTLEKYSDSTCIVYFLFDSPARPPGGPNCIWAPGAPPGTTCCNECFLNCRGGGGTCGRIRLFRRSKMISSASTDDVSIRWWSFRTAKWGWDVDNSFFRWLQVRVGLDGKLPLSLSPWPESAFTESSEDPVATVELEVFRSLVLLKIKVWKT